MNLQRPGDRRSIVKNVIVRKIKTNSNTGSLATLKPEANKLNSRLSNLNKADMSKSMDNMGFKPRNPKSGNFMPKKFSCKASEKLSLALDPEDKKSTESDSKKGETKQASLELQISHLEKIMEGQDGILSGNDMIELVQLKSLL